MRNCLKNYLIPAIGLGILAILGAERLNQKPKIISEYRYWGTNSDYCADIAIQTRSDGSESKSVHLVANSTSTVPYAVTGINNNPIAGWEHLRIVPTNGGSCVDLKFIDGKGYVADSSDKKPQRITPAQIIQTQKALNRALEDIAKDENEASRHRYE